MRALPTLRDVPWVEAPDFTSLLAARALGERERRIASDYHRDGFVVIEDTGVLDDVDTNTMWETILPHYDYEHGRLQDAWRISDGVRRVATHPRVLDVLRLLYEREPVPFQTLNFLNGTEQLTHSDTIHFSTLPARYMCGVWVALEDITLRQGPLHYFEGSHRLPDVDYEDLRIEAIPGPVDFADARVTLAYREYEQRIGEIARGSGFKRSELAIKKGSLLVWSANLLHGGSPRHDPTLTRKSQVSHYYFEHVVPITPMFSRKGSGRYYVRDIVSLVDDQPMQRTLNGRRVAFVPSEHRHTIHDAESVYSPELSERYLRRYQDVRASSFSTPRRAYEHYLIHGANEGRIYFDEALSPASA